MTVAMAVAEAVHHSAPRRQNTATAIREEVVHDAHDALRGQKTPPPGVRPGSLVDPGPQRSDRTVRRSSGKAPLLVVASLADASADGVDAATLSFLTASALEARRKEEEKEKEVKRQAQERRRRHKRREMVDELFALGNLPTDRRTPSVERRIAELVAAIDSGDSSAPSKRKRKKRRKRRTPRTSSLPGRARRRHRQWHVPVSLFDLWSMSLLCGSCRFHDEVCADIYFYFRFKLIGKDRSEQWEVFLYCDKTIKADRDSAEVLRRGVPPPDIGGVGFGSSPILDTKHTIYELCPPSVRCCVAMSCGGAF